MKHVQATALFALILLTGSISWAAGGVIKVQRDVPYSETAPIPENVRSGCTDLGLKLGQFLNEFATENGVQTELVERVDPKAGGRVLVVEITHVLSAGNAWVGHRKSMSAAAVLYQDGVSKGSVAFTRDSGGGFGGGYKGSCAVLGRCSKALGRDIADWLQRQP